MASDPLAALREAVAHSPDNLPLRQCLADTLLERGFADEAEAEYRIGLRMSPRHEGLRIGLARAFYRQGKASEALVIVEEMIKTGRAPGAAYLLSSRLLIHNGEIEQAVAHYKEAVSGDESLRDREIEERLGISLDDENQDRQESELVEGRLRAGWEEPGEGPDVEVERPQARFADVGGMEPLKEEIRLKIIYPLEQEELYRAYGKSIGGGVLMYGPPGCGKTHLARATAGEIEAGFISVGINDVLDMWIGNSERNLHEIFERARRHQPCVLFFDEVDALGARRSDMRTSAGRHLINQFLSELDGVDGNNDGVLILAATNAPWHLDTAFRRPGRFDRILFVPPPDDAARAEILRIMLSGKPAQEIDVSHVAKKLRDYSGADLKAVIDVAVEEKLQESMKSGKLVPLSTRDLLKAAKRHKPTTAEWFSTARNHALYSNEGGIYDDILKYLKL